jgi:hypothetical protein
MGATRAARKLPNRWFAADERYIVGFRRRVPSRLPSSPHPITLWPGAAAKA